MDENEPLPTSLQNDFLPQDVLLALTQPPPPQELLGPVSRLRNLNTSTVTTRKAPAGVWNYPRRREKFKHLTENTPCICGAGRDISFLYDVPKQEDQRTNPHPGDPSTLRAEEMAGKEKKPLALPDTLIPEEYHVVRNKGVMGLEYYDNQYSTQPQDHDKHLVNFPSLKPTSRYEVLQLRKTMQAMLDKAGLNSLDGEVMGPTQMHNLLTLIKKEQDIYNIVFHELIRQSSVECVDRGALLAELRDRYSVLLNKVPQQIKGLHEEVLAQRALDRRLTEELLHFKATISGLTSELSEVKSHDEHVTHQALKSQKDLKTALVESARNASLLAEYHELYQLQRLRLQSQVGALAAERELWSTAAYSLALKVTEEHSLNTAKRLHVCEKSWAKLADHFTVLLSDSDTEVLTVIQGHVDTFCHLLEEFDQELRFREDQMEEQLKVARLGLEKWIKDLQQHVFSADGHFLCAPSLDKISDIYSDVRKWEEILGTEGEKFGGNILLSGQESLLSIRQQMSGWTDHALQVFMRHHQVDGASHPDQNLMVNINQEVEKLLTQYQVRLTGENGVATGLIHVSNHLETWDNKINTLLHGSNPLPDQEWIRFCQLLEDWGAALDNTIAAIGSTQKESESEMASKRMELSSVIKDVQKWLSSATTGTDSEDARLVEQVSTLHTDMVHWMVQILLQLAPNREDHSAEAQQAVLLGSTSTTQLISNASTLFTRLQSFTQYIAMCCTALVMAIVQARQDRREEDAEGEHRDLQLLQTESAEWIRTAKMLLTELTGETFPESPQTKVTEEAHLMATEESVSVTSAQPKSQDNVDQAECALVVEKETEMEEEAPTDIPPPFQETTSPIPDKQDSLLASQQPPPEGQVTPPDVQMQPVQEDHMQVEEMKECLEEAGETLEVIGADSNTRMAPLPQSTEENATDASPPRAYTPNTKQAFEALAAVAALQDQLIVTEERAQTAEEREALTDAKLLKAQEQIRNLERQLAAACSSKTVSQGAQDTTPEFATTATDKDKAEGKGTDSPDKKTGKDGKGSRASSRASVGRGKKK